MSDGELLVEPAEITAALSPEMRKVLEEQQLPYLLELKRRRDENKFAYAWPETGEFRRERYPKHMAFFAMGKDKRIRAIFGGNRVGKSETACYEGAGHLTGRYPDWWDGYRFTRPIRAWAVGNTLVSTRDALQRKLVGLRESLGTGFVPKADLRTVSFGQHGAIDTIAVAYQNGGRSSLSFKTYEQGREKFQADEVDLIILDEEPPDYRIYTECVTRTATTNGRVILAFTALNGVTPLVAKFKPELAKGTIHEKQKEDGSSRDTITIGWDDAPHLTEQAKAELAAEYSPYEMSARTTGEPSNAAGAVYPIDPKRITVQSFQIPDDWPRVYGLDPGHKVTAVVWGAWDKQNDCVYLYSEHYGEKQIVETNAQAIKMRGHMIPGVSDDGTNVEGRTTVEMYQAQGLLVRKAQKFGKDARIQLVWSRLLTGRLKVFPTLSNWFFEFSKYRRTEDGQIVKEDDHLMDATAYLIQSGLSIARVPRPARSTPVTETTYGLY